MKICKSCNKSMPLECYNKHPSTADKHQPYCKSCHRENSRRQRQARIDYWREQDRNRGNRQGIDYLRTYRKRNPEKYKAHNALNNAKRTGAVIQENCSICGSENVHAHHPDYKKPLDVIWLCPAHHKQAHIRRQP